MNPVDSFLQWYNSLQEEAHQDLAFWILAYLPVSFGSPNGFLLDPQAVLLKWLEKENHSKFRVVGKLLHIRGVMDYYITRSLGNSHDWADKREFNESLVEELTEFRDSDLVRRLQSGLDRFPERERMWREVCTSWKVLKNGPLSLEAVEAWCSKQT